MATDRQLSRDFWLHEFSGWERATEPEVSQLQETVVRVLQPTRSHFGVELIPTSWLEWSDGTPRTGAHGYGAVDYVLADGRTREAFDWSHQYLVPAGYIGRLIYEPQRTAAEGEPQGEHIHMAPVRTMVAYNGDRTVEVLEEREEGHYVLARVAAAGLGLGAAALAAGLFFLASRHPVGAT